MSDITDTTEEPRNPFTSRGFLLGAVLVGVLVLAAILIGVSSLWGGGDEGTAPVASATPSSSPSPSSTVDAETASVCGLEGYEEDGTLTAPPVTEWVIVGTMAAPERADVGPGLTSDDGLRSCFAHTVEGALFATANLWASGTDARLSDLAIDRLTVPGPGRDAAMAADIPTSNTGLSIQIAGFKVLSYTGTDATIDTVCKLNTGQLVSFPMALKWVEGDWKTVVTDDGQPPYRPVNLTSLGGYIAWAGVQ